MEEPEKPPLLERADRRPLALLLLFALAVQVAASAIGAHGEISSLGVFFDGHKYIEIAKSFPLPYAPEGRALMGHAPGYPAVMALARLLCGGTLNWGLLAVGVAWLSGALAALAFYVLCRQCGAAPLWPTALFVVANPRWVVLASTAHPEPLAMLFAILCLVAWLRDAPGWSACWLTLAALTRFPAIVLVVPLVAALRLGPRPVSLRAALPLALPFLALAGFDAYLHWRDPGFAGIRDAHAFWWQPRWSVPFVGMLRYASAYPGSVPLRELTYVFALLYVASIVIGLRGERELRVLPILVAVVVAIAASPDDPVGARAFTRLAILAWPAALLVLWRRFGPGLPRAGVAAACALLTLASVAFAARLTDVAVRGQPREQPYLLDAIRRLDSDEPVWIDFRAYHGPGRRAR